MHCFPLATSSLWCVGATSAGGGARCHLVERFVFTCSPHFLLLQDREGQALGKAFLALLGDVGVPGPAAAQVSGTGGGPNAPTLSRSSQRSMRVRMRGDCEWVKNVRTQRQPYVISGRRRKARFEEVIEINPLPRCAGEGDTARRLGTWGSNAAAARCADRVLGPSSRRGTFRGLAHPRPSRR